MKLLIAYIQPDKLTPLREVLSKLQVFRYSISDGFGHSDEVGHMERYRGVELDVDLIKKIKIEIALNAESVDTSGAAIACATRLGRGKRAALATTRRALKLVMQAARKLVVVNVVGLYPNPTHLLALL